MNEPLITSVTNPLIKRVRSLEQRKFRQREGAFLVEGIRPVWQALESGAPVELLLVAPELLTSPPALQLIESRPGAGTRIVSVSAAVFSSFAVREHPSGLAAVVQTQHRALDDLDSGAGSLYVGLHEASNPGNLGTILRTLDAVEGSALITIGAATDPYHPTAVKAAMGALFTVPVVAVDSVAALLDWCHARGVGVVTTSSHAGGVEHWSASYPDPCLLLFGSEGSGLPPHALGAGDLAVRIPMFGAADSLNLAVSAAILLYEVRRSRRVDERPAAQ